ncbi:MAG: YkgJ family cysteine cluster protein [Planctomycetota bacterium]|jgi:Fe-S-cluster containining protein
MIKSNQPLRPAPVPEGEFICQKTGRCCYTVIPITLPDLHRIAKQLDLREERSFCDFAHRSVLTRSGLLMLRKKDDQGCLFMDENNLCTIHAFKPKICHFYQCGTNARENFMALLHDGINPDNRVQAWEHLVATALTKAYLEINGTRWNERDYRKALRRYDDYCAKKILNIIPS